VFESLKHNFSQDRNLKRDRGTRLEWPESDMVEKAWISYATGYKSKFFLLLSRVRVPTHLAFEFHLSFEYLREYQMIGSFLLLAEFLCRFSMSFFLLVDEYTGIL